MLKVFGTTRCRRCGSALEHTTDAPSPASVAASPDARLVCINCGLSRPLIYAHVRLANQTA